MARFSLTLVFLPKKQPKRSSEYKEQGSVEKHSYVGLNQFFRERATLHASMHDDVNHTCCQADE